MQSLKGGADQPLSPIGHRCFGAVPLGHLGRVGLNLMLTILAPNDQPDPCGGGATQRHRWTGLGFHRCWSGRRMTASGGLFVMRKKLSNATRPTMLKA
jgi:hypothetical protein